MISRSCLAGLTLLLAAVALAQNGDAEHKALNGKWQPIAAELAGARLAEAQLETISLTLADGQYTVQAGKSIDKGTVKLDAKAKPKAMDIVGVEGPNKGKTLLAIYEFKDDTLRVCYDLTGKNRPADFSTSKEKPFFLIA